MKRRKGKRGKERKEKKRREKREEEKRAGYSPVAFTFIFYADYITQKQKNRIENTED